jgi:hypothetical protein
MSIPYEHHQNGGVERTNHSLLDIAHTFMVDAKLPIILWPFAFKQAAYVFNRVAHDGSLKALFEICMVLSFSSVTRASATLPAKLRCACR